MSDASVKSEESVKSQPIKSETVHPRKPKKPWMPVYVKSNSFFKQECAFQFAKVKPL